MKNIWANTEARKYINKYQKLGFSEDIALRVYTTQLLGKNNNLVLHGGGNTSVKLRETNIFGEEEDILYVKGSGKNLATIDSLIFS